MIPNARIFFRKLAGLKYLNLIVEWAGNLVWILFFVVHYENEFKSKLNQLGFEKANKVKSNARFVLTDRSFLMPGFSGVTYWIQKISISLNDVPHLILCQSFHPFKKQVWVRGKCAIVLLPVLSKSITTYRLSRYLSWSKTVANYLRKMPENLVVIGSISGLETYEIRNRNNTYTLLVTDHRRNQYPQLSIDQLNNPVFIDFRSRIIAKYESQILTSQSMQFIADSRSIIRDIESLFRQKIEDRSHVAYIPADDDGCEIGPKSNEVLFVGRCDVRKNLVPLLDAWELLHGHLEGWRLVIVTSGGDDAAAANRLNSIRNQENVEILYNISDKAKHRLYRRAKIVVVPSKYESFGLVTLEALQHYCFVIANHVGGLKEIVPINFGMSIDINDISLALALARAVKIVNSPSFENSFDALSSYFDQFSMEKTRKVLMDLLV